MLGSQHRRRSPCSAPSTPAGRAGARPRARRRRARRRGRVPGAGRRRGRGGLAPRRRLAARRARASTSSSTARPSRTTRSCGSSRARSSSTWPTCPIARRRRSPPPARAAGCVVVDGLRLLLDQGAASFERWTGGLRPSTRWQRRSACDAARRPRCGRRSPPALALPRRRSSAARHGRSRPAPRPRGPRIRAGASAAPGSARRSGAVAPRPAGGATLAIETMRVPARTPSRRIGSLVVNFGGPGSSGRDYLADFAGELPAACSATASTSSSTTRGAWARARASTARSTSPPCSTSTTASRRSVGRGARARRLAAAARRASAQPRDDRDARHDERRTRPRPACEPPSATRDSRTSASRTGRGSARPTPTSSPRRVRALVLDGAVTPSTDWRKLSLDSAAAAEAAFARSSALAAGAAPRPRWRSSGDRDRAGCTRDADRRRRARDRPCLPRARRLALVRRGPWRAPVRSARLVAAGRARRRRRRAARPRGRARRLPAAGDRRREQRSPRGSRSTAPTSPGGRRRRRPAFDRTLRARYPLAGPTSDNACPRQWPAALEPLPRVVGAGAPPILVVGTRHDPVTPYRWSVELAAALRTAVLVDVAGDTHTSFAQGDGCLDPLVTRYLARPPGPWRRAAGADAASRPARRWRVVLSRPRLRLDA